MGIRKVPVRSFRVNEVTIGRHVGDIATGAVPARQSDAMISFAWVATSIWRAAQAFRLGIFVCASPPGLWRVWEVRLGHDVSQGHFTGLALQAKG